jgi:hypothetical protein
LHTVNSKTKLKVKVKINKHLSRVSAVSAVLQTTNHQTDMGGYPLTVGVHRAHYGMPILNILDIAITGESG